MANTTTPANIHKDVPDDVSEDMEVDERQAFNQLIRPNDGYTSEGTYWADLPIGQRARFVLSSDAAEARNELSWLRNMFISDPLKPVSYYFKNFVLPGAGLGLEG